MQCVILGGGQGSRISEESQLRPTPKVEVGGKPILWHIMKISARGLPWDDPAFGIRWSLAEPMLSARDRDFVPFAG